MPRRFTDDPERIARARYREARRQTLHLLYSNGRPPPPGEDVEAAMQTLLLAAADLARAQNNHARVAELTAFLRRPAP